MDGVDDGIIQWLTVSLAVAPIKRRSLEKKCDVSVFVTYVSGWHLDFLVVWTNLGASDE